MPGADNPWLQRKWKSQYQVLSLSHRVAVGNVDVPTKLGARTPLTRKKSATKKIILIRVGALHDVKLTGPWC